MESRDLELISLLKKVANEVGRGSDVYSDHFHRSVDFAKAIDALVQVLLDQDKNLRSKLHALWARKVAKYTWSMPTYDLDDYGIAPAVSQEIHELL